MRLVKNLYTYVWSGSNNNCNTCVFAATLSEGRHLMVDPGHINTPFYQEPSFDRLLKEMKEDGIDGGEIGLVVLTHAHPDHCEAAVVIQDKTKALIALHEADEATYQVIGGKADLYLDEGDLLLGERRPAKFCVYHSPGHSPGHITLYWPEQKVLIAGDVIFYHSTGRVDLPGGNAKALKQSIEKLAQLDIEYLLCGHSYGHPGIIKGKEAVRENFEFLMRNILF